MTLENLPSQALRDCFNPYDAFLSLRTFFAPLQVWFKTGRDFHVDFFIKIAV